MDVDCDRPRLQRRDGGTLRSFRLGTLGDLIAHSATLDDQLQRPGSSAPRKPDRSVKAHVDRIQAAAYSGSTFHLANTPSASRRPCLLDALDEAVASLRDFVLIDCEFITYNRDAVAETEVIRLHRRVRESPAARRDVRRALVAKGESARAIAWELGVAHTTVARAVQ